MKKFSMSLFELSLLAPDLLLLLIVDIHIPAVSQRDETRLAHKHGSLAH
jgi:hypothetical protein